MQETMTINVDASKALDQLKEAAIVQKIAEWFKLAVPSPTDKNRGVQVGCHLEEVAEMLASAEDGQNEPAYKELEALAHILKVESQLPISSPGLNRGELLDALCDQIVTAIGIAHMYKMDIVGALAEVNESNYSKFVDGQPVFNEHGKIAKGPNYRKAELSKFAEIHQ